ncbi:hypothetical protein GCM10009789_35370 [Kribbella sancticallisti]|uniref:Uncharacterized protein n=1 Tax=Kribbella sancticallisti TaxID=460087 RepID=A0ABN2DJE0_9ACTN
MKESSGARVQLPHSDVAIWVRVLMFRAVGCEVALAECGVHEVALVWLGGAWVGVGSEVPAGDADTGRRELVAFLQSVDELADAK